MGKLDSSSANSGAKSPVSRFRRWLSTWSRWLHVYLSMISFAILFFFALTGITLNHTDWFAHQQRSSDRSGSLNLAWVGTEQEVAKLETVEFLRKDLGIKGALSDFIVDDYQCTIAFNGPGYSANVFVNREDGTFELTETSSGFVGLINDLHKGRDSGKTWAFIIDLSAVLMILVSLSGLIMIFYLKKRRSPGIILAIIGLVLSYLVYLAFVP